MENNKIRGKVINRVYILLVGIIFISLAFLISPVVSSGIGNPSAIVTTTLDVGAVAPEVLNISINNDSIIILTPNTTKEVVCLALIRDYNNDTTFNASSAVLFDSTNASLGDADDNNNHYTNSSCVITNDTLGLFGYPDDEYTGLANCTFQLWYYANPTDQWNCTVNLTDITDITDSNTDQGEVASLLAIGLPNSINYGTVNATYVSDEIIANVTNFGNVELNLSFEGYAKTQSDGYAMNCSQGGQEYIDIGYEMYNVSASNIGDLSLSATQALHFNLTSSALVRDFGLQYRLNDSVNDVYKDTHWRIYVPFGVAGTCEGNIIFSAVQALAA